MSDRSTAEAVECVNEALNYIYRAAQRTRTDQWPGTQAYADALDALDDIRAALAALPDALSGAA